MVRLGSSRRVITIPSCLVTGDTVTFAADDFLLIDLYGKLSPEELALALRKIEKGGDK